MRTKLLSDDALRVYAVVFETGDEPLAGMTEFAEEAGLDAAHLTAIGAFERATVGWFDLESRDYRRIEVNEQVEVLSFAGDITHDSTEGAKPMVHVHTVLGRSNGAAVGGHLLEARVRPTLEVVVTETPAALRRRADPATGLALIDLGAGPGSGDAR
jgi:hypothetical protein